MRNLLVGIAALVWLVTVSTGFAQDRVWGNTGLYGEIVATDCQGCGDDLGMVIACQGPESNALVQVPFAAVDKRANGVLPLDITVDDRQFHFSATTDEQGLVGFVPTFELPANHPVVEAMQSGRSLSVAFAGIVAQIGLAGSRSALEIFRAHCGWNNLPAYVETAEAEPVAAAEALWSIGQVAGPGGTQMITLSYGIPQTDAVLFATSCPMDGADAVEVSLGLDLGTLGDGDPTQVSIATGGGRLNYPARAFVDGEEAAGVRFNVDSTSPFWGALQKGGEFAFRVAGGGEATATDANLAGALRAFGAACFPGAAAGLAASSPTAPRQQSAPVGAPGARPPASTDGTGNAPASGGTAAQPAPAAPAPQAAGNGSGPSNFTCDDGTQVSVLFSGAPPSETAALTINADPPLSLPVLPSSSGKLMSNGTTILMITPTLVQLVRNGKSVGCK